MPPAVFFAGGICFFIRGLAPLEVCFCGIFTLNQRQRFTVLFYFKVCEKILLLKFFHQGCVLYIDILYLVCYDLNTTKRVGEGRTKKKGGDKTYIKNKIMGVILVVPMLVETVSARCPGSYRQTPGFEAVFAVGSIVAVAATYLMLRRRSRK